MPYAHGCGPAHLNCSKALSEHNSAWYIYLNIILVTKYKAINVKKNDLNKKRSKPTDLTHT